MTCYETIMERRSERHKKRVPLSCPQPFRSRLVILRPDRTFNSEFMEDRQKRRNRFFTGFVDGKEKGTQVEAGRNCSPRCCSLFLISFFLISLGLALGIYFGFKMVENLIKKLDFSGDKVFKGLFHVTQGDVYNSSLDSQASELYKNKMLYYETRIDHLFLNSVLKTVYIKSQITQFERLEVNSTSNNLVIHFKLFFHSNKTNFDSGDVFMVMQNELEIHRERVFANIKIDLSSLQILENLNSETVQVTKTSVTSSITPEIDSTIKIDKIIPRIDTKEIGNDFKRCVPVAANFCSDVFYNLTSFPNLFGHLTRYEADEFARQHFNRLQGSGCYKYLKHFLCSLLQPACHFSQILLPCREFCFEFLTHCHTLIPLPLSRVLRCNNLPSAQNRNCLPEPDCATFLRYKNHQDWICDDVNDCQDFSDENKCTRCKTNEFYCGQNTCISQNKVCDSHSDCPNGVDELNCLFLVDSLAKPKSPSLVFSSGYLILRDRGAVGKVCVDSLNYTLISNRKYVVLNNIGRTTCELLNFKKMKFVRTLPDDEKTNLYFHIRDPFATRVTFTKAPCQSNHVIHIGCSSFVCGRPSIDNTPTNFTTRRKLGPAAWPWHISLFRDGVHACDATLLSNQWILTSRSCFQGQPKAHWKAKLGTSRHLTVSLSEQQSRVVAMTHSPVEESSLTLVKLHDPVNFTSAVRPVCVAGKDNLTADGRKCITLSWDRKGEQLYEKPVVILKSGECESSRHTACAKNLEEDNICQDEELSGSPLFCLDDDLWNVVGVLSWRVGCGMARRPMMYDKVAPNAKWIKSVLGMS